MLSDTLSKIFNAVDELKGGWPELLGSAVGASIGLFALVVGALYNAHLNRKAERERELNDRFGIIEALIAEISSVKVTLDKASVALGEHSENAGNFFVPDPCPSRGIFDKFLHRIELYDEATIQIVTELYTVLDEYCVQVVARGGAFDQSIKGRGILVLSHVDAPAVIPLNNSLSTRCADVVSELKFQRIRARHVLTRLSH